MQRRRLFLFVKWYLSLINTELKHATVLTDSNRKLITFFELVDHAEVITY